MRYKGRERRVHICFLTHNREYHVRAGECVAVRDRKSSIWIAGHHAIGLRLKPAPPRTPQIGRTLEFYSAEQKKLVRTSAVVDVLRPEKHQVEFYDFVHGFAPEDEQAAG